MNLKMMALALSIFSTTSLFAFDSVTEILPSGKLLICKQTDQERKGDIVEVYKRRDPKSLSDFSTYKASEFKLPAAGKTVKLTHKDFHQKGKGSDYHAEELGTAIISSESLEGEERVISALDNSRFARRIEKKTKISKELAEKLQRNCLVAIPQNGLKVTENAAVSWE